MYLKSNFISEGNAFYNKVYVSIINFPYVSVQVAGEWVLVRSLWDAPVRGISESTAVPVPQKLRRHDGKSNSSGCGGGKL